MSFNKWSDVIDTTFITDPYSSGLISVLSHIIRSVNWQSINKTTRFFCFFLDEVVFKSKGRWQVMLDVKEQSSSSTNSCYCKQSRST